MCAVWERYFSVCKYENLFLKIGYFNINYFFLLRNLFLCTYKNIFQSILFLQQMNLKDYFYPLLIYGQVPTEPQSCLRTCTSVICIQGKILGCFAVNRAKISPNPLPLPANHRLYELMGLQANPACS